MGLPALALNADIATRWLAVLEENHFNVRRDEEEEARVLKLKQASGLTRPSRVREVPWRVSDANTEVMLLEATFQDRGDEDKHVLIFMPTQTSPQRQLLATVQDTLIKAGAQRKR
jgi:hypothetical protein